MKGRGRIPAWMGAAGAAAFVAFAGGVTACNRPAAMTQQLDSQAKTSALHAAFARSIEAGNRAVMAADDKTAAEAANESRDAAAAIEQQIPELQQVLEALTYQIELKRLDGFRPRFEEYRRLNDDVLSLVLENTNVKAQRLSFGPSSDAAEAFHRAIEAAAAGASDPGSYSAREQAARGWASLLEIRLLYPRHIAEADDAEMTNLEAQMTAAAARVRTALDAIAEYVPHDSGPLAEARAALDRFMSIHAQILDLSRRNSNVRALALALGRKRTAAAEAEAELSALQEALQSHAFSATR